MKIHFTYLLAIFVIICTSKSGTSQYTIESVNSVYNDALTHWDIYTDDYNGSLRITWELRADLTDWTFSIDTIHGNIRQTWLNDDTSYELSVHGGKNVTMRQKWRNDYSEWTIISEDINFVWMSAQYDDGNEWGCEIDNLGSMYIFTEYLNDPRDWIVEDALPQEFLPEKMACIFITLIRAVQNFH